jgi:hypothetical protein
MTPAEPAEYDSPWKEALEKYFPEFMAFFFPEAYANIDWSRDYEFLDTEFQQIVRDAELGKRLADKLVKVWRRDGKPSLVLAHIEVQSQYEADFAQRGTRNRVSLLPFTDNCNIHSRNPVSESHLTAMNCQ